MAPNKWRIVQKGLDDINSDPTCGIKAQVRDESDWRYIIGSFKGPEDSPYEGGTFDVELSLPDQFPIRPPKARFLTRVWHLNVQVQPPAPEYAYLDIDDPNAPTVLYPVGGVCLDILKESWSPALTLKSIFLSIQQLMASPNPDSPLNIDGYSAGQNYYYQKARDWSIRYASAPRVLPTKAEKAAAARRQQAQARSGGGRSSGGGGGGGASGYHPDDIRSLENMGFSRHQILFVFDAIGARRGGRISQAEMDQAVAMLL